MRSDALECLRKRSDAFGRFWKTFAKKHNFLYCFDIFERFRKFSDVFGCVWMRSDAFGCVQIHSDASGRFRKISDFSELERFRTFSGIFLQCTTSAIYSERPLPSNSWLDV